jgi:curved DNA-binding protein
VADSLYDTLGVKKDAPADAIRSAYRKLARKHHPDVNPGDKAAEEKFKTISVAYDVLSDEKKRKAYDEFGDASLQGGFDPDKAREYARWQNTRQQQRSSGFEQGPMEFDFSELFGRATRRGPARGQDLSATIQIDFRQAIEGAEFTADIPGQGPVRVRIPPGADSGSTLRVPGKGGPGGRGAQPGDLVIEVQVMPHSVLRRDGLDLYLSLPVTIDEAFNGATVEVPTFEGPISLKIPARSQNGAKLRVKGRGVPRKSERGDFYVELAVRMPDQPDEALSEALRASKAAYGKPVREDLKL